MEVVYYQLLVHRQKEVTERGHRKGSYKKAAAARRFVTWLPYQRYSNDNTLKHSIVIPFGNTASAENMPRANRFASMTSRKMAWKKT